MSNDGQIVFEVTADGKHAIADIKEITRALQQETGKWDKETKAATDNMGNSFDKMLKKLVGGFSAVKIGKALLDIGSAAIDAASDLAEVQNVVDVTFGEDANKIEKWAKSAGKQFGLTETQAKRFSSTMGAMLKSSGLAGEQITEVSTDLAGLAADMASFYNLDFDEAFSKIRSGMSGMAMPLKELGIDMSETTLKAFAMEQGFSKSFDKMDNGEKTLVRYQYLMKATADAQGDFARTSDEFANSKRRFINNVESIKTALGQTFIDACTNAMNAVNNFLEVLLPDESKRTVLDDILDIDKKTEAKLLEIEGVKTKAEELAGILDGIFGKKNEDTGEIEGGKETADTLSKLGVKSDEAQSYLESLGFSTDEINDKQSEWLETCKRLVKTIPGLNSIINTETGEVKGGTQAVYDYIKAWEEGQTKLVMLGALEEKESAIASRFSDLPGLQLDMALEKRRAKQALEELKKVYAQYGAQIGFDANGKVLRNFSNIFGLDEDGKKALNEVADALDEQRAKAQAATDAYNLQKDALDEAKKALEEYRKTVEELPDGLQDAASATDKFFADNADSIKTIVENAETALKALDDYAQGVHDAVEKSVDSAIKGFSEIKTPMMQAGEKTTDLTKKLEKLGSRTKKNADEWDKLNEEINQTDSTKVSAQKMGANLAQQAKYMEEYLANLRKARELGVSKEVLAQLSDGSEESYDYLKELSQATPDEVKTINDNYQKVIDKKKELTDELSQQQLTVDKTYQTLAEKAKEAVDALNLEEMASENAGKTVAGVASGIAGHLPEVQEAVDAIIAEVNRLAGLGIDVSTSGVDLSIATFKKPGATTKHRNTSDRAFASGIDYVPHDMTARIHEGETILRAQEASVYRMLKYGNVSGVDLDALGGVMRDNVKAGGNVYLDGRTVGKVISDRQGASYKALQRSGWQAK